jgi:hypothetical protein
MKSKIECIKQFLTDKTHLDLANLYNGSMECQVNVARDNGERIEGDYKGKQWHGWTDGIQQWKSFRIPFNANKNPEFDKESPMRFNLEEHVEGIGLTGWDWENKLSRWVAFDFDAITGHSVGLTSQELKAVVDKASELEWVTIRKSTSGHGIHLYIFLSPVETVNHSEHAALARAILGHMSALVGFDFKSKVDACGGNMWIWHRKMKGTDGLILLKSGSLLSEPPKNWRDHLLVVRGQSTKNIPQFIKDDSNLTEAERLFAELTGQRATIKLDAEHQKLVTYLKDSNAVWWWDNDHHMLVTHTYFLAKAHEELNLKGIFKTLSEGTDLQTQNCFCFPMRNGAWAVRRFTQGVQEADSWEQDEAGWTRCFLNQFPNIAIASRTFSGIETEKGGFQFAQAEMATKAATSLGTYIELPNWATQRETLLKRHKDGRLIVEIKKEEKDRADDMRGWLPEKGVWKRIFSTQVQDISEKEVSSLDGFLRHLITETGDDYGWALMTDSLWRTEPLPHIKLSLKSMGYNSKDAENILGNSVLKCWTVVNRPFQNEYPGNRTWNRNAAQLKYLPLDDTENLKYPTWLAILNHCGASLNEVIKQDAWCKANNIVSGADYLKCWIASIIQEPLEPLPYLFFYGPQNSGKSSFHEALSLLLTKGYVRADHAITNPSGFNGELENAIVCVVEEVNLAHDRVAYNRIKDWVTTKHLNIRKLYHSPYHIPNSTHWIQCANDSSYCPVFSGDTRITMCYVETPTTIIAKRDLLSNLEREASDFVTSLIHLELPKTVDRLNLPVIGTGEKELIQSKNDTALETFLKESVYFVAGEMMPISTFYEKFIQSVDPDEAYMWSKIRVGKEMPTKFPKGRRTGDSQWCFGNMSFENIEPTKEKLTVKNGKLV